MQIENAGVQRPRAAHIDWFVLNACLTSTHITHATQTVRSYVHERSDAWPGEAAAHWFSCLARFVLSLPDPRPGFGTVGWGLP